MAISSDFRGRVAEAGVGRYLVIKSGVAANSCVLATGPTDKILGTSDELVHVTGEMVDMAVGPIGKVTLGGTVVAGDPLTADATSRAIATTTTGHRIIGYAEIPGVAGDEITYLRALGTL